MQRTITGVAAAALAASLVACAPDGPGGTAGLEDTSWSVVAVAGAPTIADARPTMTFAAEGQLGGTTGCNQYRATYHTTGASIAIGDLAATEMACDAARNAQEQAFMIAVTSVDGWRIEEDGSLHLEGRSAIDARPGDEASAGSAAPAPALPGSSWTLADLPEVDLGATAPSIAFGADGTVSGSAACNTFNGTYTMDGSAITFGPLATTRMACPDDVMAVEDAYLDALDGAASWRIGDHGRLVLEGSTTLTFDPS
jgi:heat shock protein HslJ